MKVYLYLDIDGVVCLGTETKVHNTKWGMMQRFNPKAVKVLNYVIEKTGASIVVSSDWKKDKDRYRTITDLGDIFEWQGVKYKPIDVTPSVPTCMQYLELNRAKEILMHVEEHKPDIWVAIDDLDLSEWWTGSIKVTSILQKKQDPHFVLCTRWYEGIKQSGKKEELIKKLSGNYEQSDI